MQGLCRAACPTSCATATTSARLTTATCRCSRARARAACWERCGLHSKSGGICLVAAHPVHIENCAQSVIAHTVCAYQRRLAHMHDAAGGVDKPAAPVTAFCARCCATCGASDAEHFLCLCQWVNVWGLGLSTFPPGQPALLCHSAPLQPLCPGADASRLVVSWWAVGVGAVTGVGRVQVAPPGACLDDARRYLHENSQRPWHGPTPFHRRHTAANQCCVSSRDAYPGASNKLFLLRLMLPQRTTSGAARVLPCGHHSAGQRPEAMASGTGWSHTTCCVCL